VAFTRRLREKPALKGDISPMSIAFIDLQAQRARLGEKLDAAVLEAIHGGQYIMGPQVREFEKGLAQFGLSKHALSCANGTDALVLPLMAWEVGAGDAVFCPSFTFAATAEIMPWLGAEPVFVDILPDTYNMSPAHLEATIEMVKREGRLTPKVVIAVDLFGQPADYPAIAAIAKKHGLRLIADSAQGFGCTINGKHPGHWADAVTTSFFPAKPLGCYGDGGAVLTDDDGLAELLDSLRVHGKATKTDVAGRNFEHDPKYLNMRIGMNSRLDTVQAAILSQKLAIFAEEIELRNKVASRYIESMADIVGVPRVIEGGVSTWAQFTIETPKRDRLASHLKDAGIPTAVYYPIPLHKQPAYNRYQTGPGGLPISEAKAELVISLPMHPYLSSDVQDRVMGEIRTWVGGNT
jgi:UDP-2-acetamido-2-deoxy-ribo-hexuluronate aminotransferase